MLKMQLELTGEFEVLVAEDGEKDARLRLLSAGPYSDGPADADRRRLGGYTALEEQARDARHACHRPVGPAGSGRKSKFWCQHEPGDRHGLHTCFYFREPPDNFSWAATRFSNAGNNDLTNHITAHLKEVAEIEQEVE